MIEDVLKDSFKRRMLNVYGKNHLEGVSPKDYCWFFESNGFNAFLLRIEFARMWRAIKRSL